MEFEPKTTFPIYMVVSMYMQDMNNQRVKSNKKNTKGEETQHKYKPNQLPVFTTTKIQPENQFRS